MVLMMIKVNHAHIHNFFRRTFICINVHNIKSIIQLAHDNNISAIKKMIGITEWSRYEQLERDYNKELLNALIRGSRCQCRYHHPEEVHYSDICVFRKPCSIAEHVDQLYPHSCCGHYISSMCERIFVRDSLRALSVRGFNITSAEEVSSILGANIDAVQPVLEKYTDRRTPNNSSFDYIRELLSHAPHETLRECLIHQAASSLIFLISRNASRDEIMEQSDFLYNLRNNIIEL